MTDKVETKLVGTGMKHRTAKTDAEFMAMEISPEQMGQILEQGFGIKKEDWKCHYCGEQLTTDNIGGVMPDDKGNPITLCKFIGCMLMYYDDFLID